MEDQLLSFSIPETKVMLKLIRKFTPTRKERTLLGQRQLEAERRQRIFAFLLPMFAFYVAYAAHGLWPVGNRHLLAYDLYHQYAPFLLELKRKILSCDNLFFSWSGGLGVNFYSIFTYYVASPLNILVIFFPDQNIAEAVMVLTTLKIGLSGLFFREFLSGSFRRRDPLSALFGAFYALSAWVYAYSWNIMWLDTLVLFPLAALGLVQLVRDGKMRLFVVSMTLMLLTNYYTAFFACAFLLLYYFVLRVQFRTPSGQRDPKCSRYEPLISFGKFAGGAVLSALLAGIVLCPTVRALSITSAAHDAFPQGFTFTQAFLDTLGRMTPLRPPNIMSGLPNIYAGMPVIMLLPAFFADKRRPRGVRLAYGALLGFLLFSFQSRTLSFLWHGAHYPNSLDFRYAFVFILLVLAMAYQAAGDDLSRHVAPVAFTAAAIFVLLLAEQRYQLNDALSHWRIAVFLVFVVGYLMVFSELRASEQKGQFRSRPADGGSQEDTAALPQRGIRYRLSALRKRGRRRQGGEQIVSRRLVPSREALWNRRKITHKDLPLPDRHARFQKIKYHRAHLIFFAFMMTEVLFHAITSAALYQQVAPLGDRRYYTSNTYGTEFYAYVSALKAENKGRPWRAEILPDTCVNDPFLYGTNGLSLFASPFPKASIAYFSDLGYPTNGVNSMQYKESTIVMDSLLSINHLLVRGNRVFDDRSRTLVSTGEETKHYVNRDALPFGFFACLNAGYLDGEVRPEDHFDVQNQLLAALGGEPDVLVKEAFVPWGQEGCYVEPSLDPYSFRVVREQGNSEWAFLVYDVPEDGIYYVSWEDVSVGITYSNGFIRDDQFFQLGGSKRGIGDVGFLEAGTKLHFRVNMSTDKAVDGVFRASVGRLDQAAWKKSREKLAAHPLRLDLFRSNAFSGTITAPEKGYLFLPTTGNPGWTFKVDGVVTEAETIGDCFIILPLSAGKHTVSAHFVPAGFAAGALMTATGLVIAGVLYWLKQYRKKRTREKAV